MRPARRIKHAEEAARRLKALISSPIMSQLLQHTPPAALTAEQAAHLSSCCIVISQLQDSFRGAPLLTTQLVDALLKQQVAFNVGHLVTWVQQQPEQQLLDLTAVVAVAGRNGSVDISGGRTAHAWAAGVSLLWRIAVAAAEHNAQSMSLCSLAATLTQQLDQSGKACSWNCNCTAR
jgi:hypothetical protein